MCVCSFLWWRRVTLRKLKQGGLLFTTTDGKCERIHKAWRQLPFLPLWGMLTSTKSAVGITRQFSCHWFLIDHFLKTPQWQTLSLESLFPIVLYGVAHMKDAKSLSQHGVEVPSLMFTDIWPRFFSVVGQWKPVEPALSPRGNTVLSLSCASITECQWCNSYPNSISLQTKCQADTGGL